MGDADHKDAAPLLKIYVKESLPRLFRSFTAEQLRKWVAAVTTVNVDIPHESRPRSRSDYVRAPQVFAIISSG